MSQKYIPDYLSPAEAAEYLQCSENTLKHLLAECKIRAGLFVPGWKGEAMPAPISGLPRSWEGGITRTDAKGKTDSYQCKETGEEFTVRRGWISQFWFIHHADAYQLVTTEADSIEVNFLDPVDCQALHEFSPEHFPATPLIYWLDSQQEVSRKVTWENLLFRRVDLDMLIEKPTTQLVASSTKGFRDTTLLSTIAALLLNWPGGAKKAPSAKELEKAAVTSGISISDSSIRAALDSAISLMKQSDRERFTR